MVHIEKFAESGSKFAEGGYFRLFRQQKQLIVITKRGL
jgi:hypothetical protein